jgi:hypothetical protein
MMCTERSRGPCSLLAEELQRSHLDLEQEAAVGRNAPRREAPSAVALVRGDVEPANLSDGHAEAALVPALDDTSNAGLR